VADRSLSVGRTIRCKHRWQRFAAVIEGAVELAALGLSLPLAGIYRDTGLIDRTRDCAAIAKALAIAQASQGLSMKARVTVTLKQGVLDPQGKAIEGALRSLGVEGVASVRQGKVFDIELATCDKASAEEALKSACDKLLANTVIEDYRVEIAG